ncbi:hypothetical protein [Commensalibacter sp. ESL0382]|uniref:hypothetical protein n=1 Tax=unclassified Commensalibacter TaxID=2630218 RepID=UPI0012D9BC67|nr:hypothetical protein [Commensalibacter sp. ESL0382]MUG35135.1 hypothetical protein [Commensalibacter sp. ESL0382]
MALYHRSQKETDRNYRKTKFRKEFSYLSNTTPQKMLLEMRMRKAHLMLQSKDQVRKPPGT